MSNLPTCVRCGVVLSPWQRADAVYCTTRCRVAAHRARRTAGASPIPAALRELDRWVRHDAMKRPLTVDGYGASSTNARTWTTYAVARASTAGNGLGFVLDGSGICCVDIDHCLTGDGGLAPWAAAILDAAPSTWIEVSPSGQGLHVWGLGRLPAGRVVTVDGGKVEVYATGRYMTVTGQRFEGAPSELAPIGDLIATLTM